MDKGLEGRKGGAYRVRHNCTRTCKAKGEATKEEKEPYRLKQEVSIYLYPTQGKDGRQNKIRGYNQGKQKRPVTCMYVLTSQNGLRSFKFAAHVYNCRERFHLEVRNPVGTQFSL